MPERIVVILPTYNERENLPVIVPRILAHGPEWHVLVADDRSPDGTGEVADELAAADARVQVLHRTGPKGLGAAYREALVLALRRGFDFIFMMDCDLSHDPKELPAMLRLAGERGSAIGSRYVRGGGSRNWGWHRKINSYSANLLTRLALGLRVRDASTGFRCYRRDMLERINPRGLSAEGYSIMEELSFRLEKLGCRAAEHPITFAPRIRGASKLSLKQIWDVLRMLARLRMG